MAEPAIKDHTWSDSDWSLLPEELLHIISEKLENCFDVIHARSVCRTWRSIFPFPSWLLRTSYSLPSRNRFLRKGRDLCTLEKFPMFLFRVRSPANALPSEFFLGGISRDKSEDGMKKLPSPMKKLPSPVKKLPSPIQCSVKVKKIGESDPTLMNILDCQILPLGYHYRVVGWDPDPWKSDYVGVAFLQLRGAEFVVLIGCFHNFWVLRSGETRLMRLEKPSRAACSSVVAFRGRFYATFLNGDIFVLDPYTLVPTPLMPSTPLRSSKYLFPSGDDELFLVEKFNPCPEAEILDFCRWACRVSVLDEMAGEWVVVTSLRDRLFFRGDFGNVCCLAKELPDGCGLSKNSIVFTNYISDVTYAYKYGVEEEYPYFWRFSRETRVTILSTYSVVALRVER